MLLLVKKSIPHLSRLWHIPKQLGGLQPLKTGTLVISDRFAIANEERMVPF